MHLGLRPQHCHTARAQDPKLNSTKRQHKTKPQPAHTNNPNQGGAGRVWGLHALAHLCGCRRTGPQTRSGSVAPSGSRRGGLQQQQQQGKSGSLCQVVCLSLRDMRMPADSSAAMHARAHACMHEHASTSGTPTWSHGVHIIDPVHWLWQLLNKDACFGALPALLQQCCCVQADAVVAAAL